MAITSFQSCVYCCLNLLFRRLKKRKFFFSKPTFHFLNITNYMHLKVNKFVYLPSSKSNNRHFIAIPKGDMVSVRHFKSILCSHDSIKGSKSFQRELISFCIHAVKFYVKKKSKVIPEKKQKKKQIMMTNHVDA
jgi:hypothetical protein